MVYLSSHTCSVGKNNVKNILECLSFGDTFGKVSQKSDTCSFVNSRESYNDCVKFPFDPSSFMKTNNFETICFFVRGQSGSGKTHFIKNNLLPFLLKSYN